MYLKEINIAFVLALIIITVLKSSEAVPCTKIVKIESKELYSYLATVTFSTPKKFNGIWKLDLQTHVPYLFLGGWGGIVITADGQNGLAEIQSAEEVDIEAGGEISFRFRISWNPYSDNGPIIPLVKSIIWEGQPVCSSVSSVLKKPQFDNSIVKMKRRNKFLKRIPAKYLLL